MFSALGEKNKLDLKLTAEEPRHFVQNSQETYFILLLVTMFLVHFVHGIQQTSHNLQSCLHTTTCTWCLNWSIL